MKSLVAALFALSVISVYSQGPLVYKVVDVIDAETVVLLSSRDVRSTVRIVGIDAPESDQPCGKESVERLTALLKGKDVTSELIKIANKRTVSRLRLDGLDVGLTMIGNGYAWHRNERGELSETDAAKYAAVQADAKGKKAGLWANNAIDPKDWRRAAASKAVTSVRPEDTFVGIVDTNYYYPFRCDEARFDPNTLQRSFITEAEAQKAGFKKATICSKPRPVVAQTYSAEKSQPLRSARAIKIIQMTSDYHAFSEKVVTVEGDVSMSTMFVGPFYGEDESFYSFRIDDGTDAILAFTGKTSGAAQLRQVLLRSGDATIWAKVRVKILGRTVGGIVFGSMIDFVSR